MYLSHRTLLDDVAVAHGGRVGLHKGVIAVASQHFSSSARAPHRGLLLGTLHQLLPRVSHHLCSIGRVVQDFQPKDLFQRINSHRSVDNRTSCPARSSCSSVLTILPLQLAGVCGIHIKTKNPSQVRPTGHDKHPPACPAQSEASVLWFWAHTSNSCAQRQTCPLETVIAVVSSTRDAPTWLSVPSDSQDGC